MAVTRKEKETILTSLIDRIKQARGIVFAEYRGLTVAEANKLRKSLRKENVTYQVVKVTLLKKALTELKIQAGNLKFKGP
ncbi:MAG TPA: 50S ribosomal protein L10, partial [Patescibacteria group bacterium]|nr:50S ribosomal protein L10 [Patescibacteria group bacterium]